MCNLLVPLCPFVLHAVAASQAAAANDAPSDLSSDAKILFSYLSKRPYQAPGSQPSDTSNQPLPLSLPSLKLYKRINWHTCPCFFNRILVLHPRPGPSRPTFGCASKYCSRCSSAATLLRPMRRGGPMDRNTRSDPYWNRCIFLGASGVFESDDDDVCEDDGNHGAPQVQPVGIQQHSRRDRRLDAFDGSRSTRQQQWDRAYEQRTNGRFDGENESKHADHSRHVSGTKSRYQAELDSYLDETYGRRG